MNNPDYNRNTSHCVQHWWHQRLSALLMTPLIIWLIILSKRLANKSPIDIVDIVKEPVNFIMMVLMLMLVFYHAVLGLRVIIEDYISNLFVRYTLIILLQCFSLITVISSIVAIILLNINY